MTIFELLGGKENDLTVISCLNAFDNCNRWVGVGNEDRNNSNNCWVCLPFFPNYKLSAAQHPDQK